MTTSLLVPLSLAVLVVASAGGCDSQTRPEDMEYVTSSGLRYVVLDPGDGASPQTGDTVSVHYDLWLEDGDLVDSSRDRGQPFEFVAGIGRVIAGLDEAVLAMAAGAHWRLTIPPHLGYGEGAGVVPPNATLVMDLELLAITPSGALGPLVQQPDTVGF